MKYGVYINQFAISQAGFDFDLTDAAVFDMLKDYCNSKACKKMMHDGIVYYNVPYKIVIEELPLAKLKKPDSVYRRFQKLEQNGIIGMHPDNRIMKQVWFAWGRNYDQMLSTYKTGSKSDQTPNQYGLESDTTDLNPVYYGLESGLSTDLNPTLPNTISFNYPQLELERARENEPESFNLEAEKNTPSPIPPAPSPAAPSWRDRPRTDTPAQMSDDLRRFYTAYPDDWKKMLDESGAKYPAAELRGIVTAFCAYQIENNRTANTYRQTHAALQRWLINQKSMKPSQPQPRPVQQTATAANLRVYE